MAFGLETGPENVVKIKVIGVGGGGNNVVNRMVRTGAHHAVNNVVAAAANADDLDLHYVLGAGFQSECHVGSSCNLLYGQSACRCKRYNIRYLLSSSLYYGFPAGSIAIGHFRKTFLRQPMLSHSGIKLALPSIIRLMVPFWLSSSSPTTVRTFSSL